MIKKITLKNGVKIVNNQYVIKTYFGVACPGPHPWK